MIDLLKSLAINTIHMEAHEHIHHNMAKYYKRQTNITVE